MLTKALDHPSPTEFTNPYVVGRVALIHLPTETTKPIQVLLVEQGNGRRPILKLPGGRPDDNERILTTILREFHEETGSDALRRIITSGSYQLLRWRTEDGVFRLRDGTDGLRRRLTMLVVVSEKPEIDDSFENRPEINSIAWHPLSKVAEDILTSEKCLQQHNAIDLMKLLIKHRPLLSRLRADLIEVEQLKKAVQMQFQP